MSETQNRRDFLKASALAAGGVALGGARRTVAANDRVTLGYIGTGRMGLGNMRHQLEIDQADIAAVCDVYQPSLDKAVEMLDGKVDAYVDFRRLLDRQDIDAVVVSSPDHWHALHTVLACEAGKDVFVEKPLATSIGEGRRMVDVARRTSRVVQVGTMQRSAEHFQHAIQMVRDGAIGKVSFVRCWNASNEYPEGIGNPADGAPPAGLDWDLWLGPAPERPFNTNRFGVGDRWSTFRFFWDYAGGMLTDWGIHLMDIAIWAMQDEVPNRVTTSGGKYFLSDNRDTPDTLQSTYEFDDWVMTYTNQACNGRGFDGRGYGIHFHGTEGTMFVDRSGFEVMPEYHRDPDGIAVRPKTPALRGRSIGSGNREHHENWLDCVRSREQPICDVEIGHRSSVLPHLGNIAYRTGSMVDWDGVAEKCVGNSKANALIDRKYRKQWRV
ncbi:MAG: Gfo/Idh/MocA family oxidoreductase [Acidobacteriota bacterium]|nr:Gfo/Idh/MocA family oxidoreductase [Acidobacteriota bacterium]